MKILLFLFFLPAYSILNASVSHVDTIPVYITVYQKVDFITSDSTYNFTIFIDPEGKFYFRPDYFTESLEDDSKTLYLFNRRKQTDTYTLKYQFLPGTDTIYSAYSVEKIEDPELHHKQIADLLTASYVMRQMFNSKVDNLRENEIRVLYPNEDLNFCRDYSVVTISFFEDSARINIIEAVSRDHNGLQPRKNTTAFLKKRDIRKLQKQLEILNEIPGSECRYPGNPWLMEYYNNNTYKRFFISYACLRETRQPKPILRTLGMIMGLGSKYSRN